MNALPSQMSTHRSIWSVFSEDLSFFSQTFYDPKFAEMMDAVKLMNDFERVNDYYSEEESKAMRDRVFLYLVEIMEILNTVLAIPIFLQKCNEDKRYSHHHDELKILKEYCSCYLETRDVLINPRILDENLVKAAELICDKHNKHVRNEICKKGHLSISGKIFSEHLSDMIGAFRDKLESCFVPLMDPISTLSDDQTQSVTSICCPSTTQQEHEAADRQFLREQIKEKKRTYDRHKATMAANDWRTKTDISMEFEFGYREGVINCKKLEKRVKDTIAERDYLKDIYGFTTERNVFQLRSLIHERHKVMLLLQAHTKKYDEDIGKKMRELESLKQDLKDKQDEFDEFLVEFDRLGKEYKTILEEDHAEEELARTRRVARHGGHIDDEDDFISEDLPLVTWRKPIQKMSKMPVKKRK